MVRRKGEGRPGIVDAWRYRWTVVDFSIEMTSMRMTTMEMMVVMGLPLLLPTTMSDSHIFFEIRLRMQRPHSAVDEDLARRWPVVNPPRWAVGPDEVAGANVGCVLHGT